MTTKPEIQPWMKKCAQHIDDAYAVAIQQQCVGTEPPIIEVAYIIAAHAPKQEPSVPVSKLKEIRKLKLTIDFRGLVIESRKTHAEYIDMFYIDGLIHAAEKEQK
jgi:hypothetical protein